MNREFEYQSVMDFCTDKLAKQLENLQSDLKNLRIAVDTLQNEDFHGEGAGSTIRTNYGKLYTAIGVVAHDDDVTVNVAGSGLWTAACIAKTLTNLMYTNAEEFKNADNTALSAYRS